jgi:hypothetical protein
MRTEQIHTSEVQARPPEAPALTTNRDKSKNTLYTSFRTRELLEIAQNPMVYSGAYADRVQSCQKVSRVQPKIHSLGHLTYDILPSGWNINLDTGDVVERNVGRCKSPACPFCAVPDEWKLVRAVSWCLERASEAKKGLVSITFTCQNSFDASKQAKDLILAHQKVFSQACKVELQKEFGWEGSHRAYDHTYNDFTGHHGHLADIHIFKTPLSEEQLELFGEFVFSRWRKFSKKVGLGTPVKTAFYCKDVSNPIALANYNSGKARKFARELNLALEQHSSRTKLAHETNRNRWELLRDSKPYNRASKAFTEAVDALSGIRTHSSLGIFRELMKLFREVDEETTTMEDVEEAKNEMVIESSDRFRRTAMNQYGVGWLKALGSSSEFRRATSIVAALEMTHELSSRTFCRESCDALWECFRGQVRSELMTDDAIKDFFLDLLISANKKEDEEVLLSFPQHFSAIQV